MYRIGLTSLVFTAMTATAALADTGTQPADGLWRGTWQTAENAGCPQMLIDQIGAMTAGAESYEKALTFPRPFDPSGLHDSEIDYGWTQIAPDHWTGSYTETQKTQLGQMTVSVAQDLQVKSPEAMDQTVVTTVQMPKTIGKLLKMTDGTCAWTSTAEHRLDQG